MSRILTAESHPALPKAAYALGKDCLDQALQHLGKLCDLEGAGEVRRFEEAFAPIAGVPYALALSSGSVALYTALLASDIGPGDEVIVAPYGWGQTVAAILACGATPVFADVDVATGNLDPEAVEQWLGSATRAVLVTHCHGCPAPLEALCALCDAKGIPLIADAAQALGATLHDRPVAIFAHITCFSLGRGKAVCAGEGGVAVTADPELFERMVLVSQHPLRGLRDIEGPDLHHSITELNLSYRLAPLAAALARGQLPNLAESQSIRTATAGALAKILAAANLTYFVSPIVPLGVSHAWYAFVLRYLGETEDRPTRKEVVAALHARGVPAQLGPVREPLPMRPPFLDQRHGWYPHALRPRVRHPSWDSEAWPRAQQRCTEEVLISSESRWGSVSKQRIEELADAIVEIDQLVNR